jgi:hypothetical protein
VRLTGPGVGWTRIGPNNGLRGSPQRRAQPRGGGQLVVEDRGTGTYGVRKPIAAAGGWRPAPDTAVEVTLDGQVRCTGTLSGGPGTPGTVIARLPEGARPARVTRVLCVDSSGAPVPLSVDESGDVRLLGSGATRIDLTALQLPAVHRPPVPDTDP